MNKLFCIILLIMPFLFGCGENYTPKPRGYFRIDFPAKTYQRFDSICPFAFEFPQYGKVEKDVDKNAEPYWMNIVFKDFKSKIHLSYKPVNNNLNKFIEDAHTMAYKHTIKADAIDEKLIIDEKRKVYGLLYEIRGNAASSVQFYVTDSARHFLRGSLYFDVVPNKDSLAPAIEFFRKDIMHLIETLQWKNKL
ncbi:MAG: gliding motility lipoprotein GldD [Bacteroidota bacterium]|nr:gliding motility lipoprotein GldD [Bacteroidota bacterium]